MLLNRKKVLIVDPSPIFRRHLKAVIQTNETLVDVTEADDTKQAEAALRNRQSDVVFLEIGVPPDEGIRLIEFIKSLAPGIRIVVLTSHDSADNKTAALQKGADYFISKEQALGIPLIDVIHETIRRH